MITLDNFTESTGDVIEQEHRYPKGVEKVLEVLGDGRWHTGKEIMERSNQMRYGARIWEAKRDFNLDIEYRRDGIWHLYRWVKS